MNRINFPWLLPVRFYTRGKTQLPNYYHKDFTEYPFLATQQQPWAQKKKYYQKWQNNDIIYFQFTSNFSQIAVQVLDCKGVVKLTFNALPVRADKYNPGYYCYEVSISLVSLPEGLYKLLIPLGDEAEESDWMHIKQLWPNTILFEYWHSRYHLGVFFESGIRFQFRIEGTIGRLIPGSADTVYEDQLRNPHTLSSKPYRAKQLSVGGAAGVPDWAVDLYNYIWSCNSVYMDGLSYGKGNDTKLEPKGEKNYPMQAITMTVREGINRPGRVVEPGLDTGKKLAVLNAIEGTVFGDVALGAASNIIVINSIE